ncbi:hypothetical protein OSB04_023022 [Centaurea solstitialis]|uniref:Uncharacterized protein n=1 Tax=Centaurea solstitialis TaxID=347529 RepID=A0AA38SID1_9ASTR|nr:hypothetical protein OSB04_023022 [Centaurea solstitialis]
MSASTSAATSLKPVLHQRVTCHNRYHLKWQMVLMIWNLEAFKTLLSNFFFILYKKQRKEFSPSSIHTVPSRLRDLNPRAFDPRFFSIGPLHRMDENLLAFEEQKPIFLHDLLSGSSSPEQTLETCVEKVNASIDRIRACYEDGMKSYSDDEVARMMVMDACFILEFSYKLSVGDFDENMLLEPAMINDLLLIENQLPFFVLQHMFDCNCSRFKLAATSLNQLILPLVQVGNIFTSNLTIENASEAHSHILGLMHKCYQPSHTPSHVTGSELDRAGVNFKPHHHDPQWSLAIELESPPRFIWPWAWAKPTLRMPVLLIDDNTELIFRNLIAYEQLSPQVDHYITSYAIAMDMLIDNQDDIAILVESKVLLNVIGSKEEAANMINDICKYVSCKKFFYWGQWQKLDTYYNGYWPKNIAWLRRTYFSSPWNFIALLANPKSAGCDSDGRLLLLNG